MTRLGMFQDCDIPSGLADVPYVDMNDDDWWSQLLAMLIPISAGRTLALYPMWFAYHPTSLPVSCLLFVP